MIDKIKSLHETWCFTTGQQVNYRATERIFFELANLDFTAEDLLSVLKHVMSFNKTHPECQMKVQVHKICGDIEAFASICAESKARERNRVKPPTPKESILHSWRGISPEQPGKCVPINEVIKGLREAANL